MRLATCYDDGGSSGRRTPDHEQKFSLVGGAHLKGGLDLLERRLRTADNVGQFLHEGGKVGPELARHLVDARLSPGEALPNRLRHSDQRAKRAVF